MLSANQRNHFYSEEIDDRGDDGDSDDDTEEAIGAANVGKLTKYCHTHITYDLFCANEYSSSTNATK